MQKLKREAAKVYNQRVFAERAETSLRKALMEFLEGDTTANDVAALLQISPQYLSDIKNFRRSISDEVVKRLVNLQ